MGGMLSNLLGGDAACCEGPETSAIKKFSSSAQWEFHFNSMKESSQLMVVFFSASWCGPCKFILPAIRSLADNFTDVSFVRMDVDDLSDVATEFNVTAFPTFVLFKRGKEVERIVGAKKDELEKKVIKLRHSEHY